MFTALLENGTPFHLFHIRDKNALSSLKKNTVFFCPECGENVTLKLGEKKQPHFAHLKKKACNGNGEAESSYHLNGKLQLYERLLALGMNPELEPYFPAIKQRGDIGVEYNGKYYVIEFQCSIIPASLLKKRTASYRKANCIPIWIVGHRQGKAIHETKFKLSAFMYLFITFYHHRNMLPFYCPLTKNFYIMHSLFPISTTTCYQTTTCIPLDKVAPMSSPLNLPQKKVNFYDWKRKINQQKNHSIHYPTKENNRFLQNLYVNGLHPHFLPPFIGLPLQESISIETSPLFWQSYVFMDSFFFPHKQPISSIYKIYTAFQKRVNSGEIVVRDFPLSPANWKLAINAYIHLLKVLEIIEEVKPKFYRLKNQINIIKNYEQQQKIEDIFYLNLATRKNERT